jgi:hypothetical protein
MWQASPQILVEAIIESWPNDSVKFKDHLNRIWIITLGDNKWVLEEDPVDCFCRFRIVCKGVKAYFGRAPDPKQIKCDGFNIHDFIGEFLGVPGIGSIRIDLKSPSFYMREPFSCGRA